MSEPAPYDPAERRNTPLAKRLISELGEGTMPLRTFIARCLYDEDFGYYTTQAGIGRDFVTAPEISQTFGELIGLWCAAVWQAMGSPPRIRLIEYGPGRGTMMRDVLRAARALPDFRAALLVELYETSQPLQGLQAETLNDCDVPISWSIPGRISGLMSRRNSTIATEPQVPTLLIGNEFFDCFPISQAVLRGGTWMDRHVGVRDGRLEFVTVALSATDESHVTRALPDPEQNLPDGLIVETPHYDLPAADLRAIASAAPSVAGLFVDYGHLDSDAHPHETSGDTVQAVRNHKAEHPLTSPGEADLTHQVRFSLIRAVFEEFGLAVDGPTTQAEFLGSLGLMERASRLMAANPHQAGAIEAGVMRLMAPNGMGTRFKVVGTRTPSLPPLPGLPPLR